MCFRSFGFKPKYAAAITSADWSKCRSNEHYKIYVADVIDEKQTSSEEKDYTQGSKEDSNDGDSKEDSYKDA